MTIAERLAPVARTIADARVGRRLRRDMSAIGNDAADVVDQVVDAIAKVAEDLARNAERAGADAKKETKHMTRDFGEVVSDAFEAVSTAAGDAAAKAGDAAAKAGDAVRDLHLDDRVEDVVERIRSDFPSERITSLVTNLERELPTTDKDRYDRAYLRGWTRARTAFVGVGLATGVAAGIAGAFLLDPQRGPERRAVLQSRARNLGTTVTRVARGKATWTVDRARGIAIERGLVKPDSDAEVTEDIVVAAPAPLVPVMDSMDGDGAVVASEVTALDDSSNPDAIARLADDGAPVPMADDGAPVPTNPGA